LQHTDAYYKAALGNLREPTREHVELSIMQNQGGLSVFGTALSDSIRASHLSNAQKDALEQNIAKTIQAMNGYITALKTITANKNQVYRSFRIGKEMFTEKFKYDLAIDFTPEQLYEKATADKQFYYNRMFDIAGSLWNKYYKIRNKPTDSLQLVQMVLDKIQLQHTLPKDFFDSLTSQVHQLKKFIIEDHA
jgi:hypothetical protein